jgi:hypothetical protein
MIGEFQGQVLYGMGKHVTENEIIEDGIFKNGKLNGIGVIYDTSRNEYHISAFKDGNKLKTYRTGEDFPVRDISE